MKLRDGDVWLALSAGVNLRFLNPSHGLCRAIFRISLDPSRESRTDQVLLLQDALDECPPRAPTTESPCVCRYSSGMPRPQWPAWVWGMRWNYESHGLACFKRYDPL